MNWDFAAYGNIYRMYSARTGLFLQTNFRTTFWFGPRCYRHLLPSELRTCEGSLRINLFSVPHCLRQRIVCSKQTSLQTNLHHESPLPPTVPYIRRATHVLENLLIPHITTKGCIIF